jgi:hypothetical protein
VGSDALAARGKLCPEAGVDPGRIETELEDRKSSEDRLDEPFALQPASEIGGPVDAMEEFACGDGAQDNRFFRHRVGGGRERKAASFRRD